MGGEWMLSQAFLNGQSNRLGFKSQPYTVRKVGLVAFGQRLDNFFPIGFNILRWAPRKFRYLKSKSSQIGKKKNLSKMKALNIIKYLPE
jgi:hypothetical protein